MAEVTVTTQKEFDALPAKFDEFTYVYIKSDSSIQLSVNRQIENAHVVAWGSSHVEAWGSSHVVAWVSFHVEARVSSDVVARESYAVEVMVAVHVEGMGALADAETI